MASRKIIYGMLVVLGFIFGLPVVIGSFLPRDHKVEVLNIIDASADEVFSFAVNIDSWPEWRSGIEKVVHKDPETFTVAITIDGDTVDYRFEGDFEIRKMSSTIVTDDLPYGGKWIINVDPIDKNSAKLILIEEGFIDPPFWRFISKYFIGHDTNISQFGEEIQVHCRNGKCEIN